MVDNFREFLRFPTVQPDPDYGPAVDFLKGLGDELGLESTTLELFPTKLILIMKWEGNDPSAESILLNSHMDVVPVYPERWTYDPFEAHMDEKGDIYARGTQDMKCVTIQYLEAIRKLKAEGYVPRHTIYVSVMPDEEILGAKGMAAFIKTDYFKSLNIGFSLDEGVASHTDVFNVFNGERTVMPFNLICHGNPGHGSMLIPNTAGEKLISCLSSIEKFRKSQMERLKNNPSLSLGDVTTVNLTMMNGGVQANVIPATLTACCDLKLEHSYSFEEFCQQVLPQANGKDIIIEPRHPTTPVEPTSLEVPYCKAFYSACEELGIKTFTSIFSAGTDGRYLRKLGIPVIGFSPMNNTPILYHDHDEYLNKDVFLRGIDIYVLVIKKISQ